MAGAEQWAVCLAADGWNMEPCIAVYMDVCVGATFFPTVPFVSLFLSSLPCSSFFLRGWGCCKLSPNVPLCKWQKCSNVSVSKCTKRRCTISFLYSLKLKLFTVYLPSDTFVLHTRIFFLFVFGAQNDDWNFWLNQTPICINGSFYGCKKNLESIHTPMASNRMHLAVGATTRRPWSDSAGAGLWRWGCERLWLIKSW